MTHDTLIEQTSSAAAATGGACSPGSSPAVGLEQQRLALQRRVQALRQAGALPAAAAVGQPASAVQWNNWSNG